MARLLMMTDLSESYATKLLQGIIQYSHEHEPWVVAKIPLSFRDANQLKTVAEIATHWRADAIIGQFRSFEDARIFQERGIIPVAQDYKQVFPGIINITGDYQEAGRMAARYFLERGLRNFAFYGLRSVVWSDGRREGFAREIEERQGSLSGKWTSAKSRTSRQPGGTIPTNWCTGCVRSRSLRASSAATTSGPTTSWKPAPAPV